MNITRFCVVLIEGRRGLAEQRLPLCLVDAWCAEYISLGEHDLDIDQKQRRKAGDISPIPTLSL